MRKFLPRPDLSVAHAAKLTQKTNTISTAADQKTTAETIYTGARQTKWFANSVIKELKSLAGAGERCMFCGGSEASQVDHFKPKADFPLEAMKWENFVWICGFCNQNKGINFLPMQPAPIF